MKRINNRKIQYNSGVILAVDVSVVEEIRHNSGKYPRYGQILMDISIRIMIFPEVTSDFFDHNIVIFSGVMLDEASFTSRRNQLEQNWANRTPNSALNSRVMMDFSDDTCNFFRSYAGQIGDSRITLDRTKKSEQAPIKEISK